VRIDPSPFVVAVTVLSPGGVRYVASATNPAVLPVS
jgi:hypothetical protein